jgi:hypothetical protein
MDYVSRGALDRYNDYVYPDFGLIKFETLSPTNHGYINLIRGGNDPRYSSGFTTTWKGLCYSRIDFVPYYDGALPRAAYPTEIKRDSNQITFEVTDNKGRRAIRKVRRGQFLKTGSGSARTYPHTSQQFYSAVNNCKTGTINKIFDEEHPITIDSNEKTLCYGLSLIFGDFPIDVGYGTWSGGPYTYVNSTAVQYADISNSVIRLEFTKPLPPE